MKTKTLLLLLSLTLLAIVSAAFAFGRPNGHAAADRRLTPLAVFASGAGAAAKSSLPAVPVPDKSDVEVLLLTLRPTGFESREVTLPAGDYVLIVRNRSGLDEFGVRLARETGENLREAKMPRHKRDWKHFLKLTPGNYVLTEVDHPDWTCRIKITAR